MLDRVTEYIHKVIHGKAADRVEQDATFRGILIGLILMAFSMWMSALVSWLFPDNNVGHLIASTVIWVSFMLILMVYSGLVETKIEEEEEASEHTHIKTGINFKSSNLLHYDLQPLPIVIETTNTKKQTQTPHEKPHRKDQKNCTIKKFLEHKLTDT